MPKVAVVTDTNSAVLPEEAKALGFESLAMPFSIDGKEYREGVDLTHEEFYRQMEAGADIVTSQPSPGMIMELWDELLKTHDELVYIPMSSGLSGSYQTAQMLSDDYDGKVQVVNNQRIGATQGHSAEDALALAAQGKNAAGIKEILEREKFQASIYITLNTLYYLKKGGRITPAAAAIGTLLKIKPVLTIQGEKLDAFAKVRTMVQAKNTMINAIKNDIEKRFNGDVSCLRFDIHHTTNEEAAGEFAEEVGQTFGVSKVPVINLPLSIATHIGPGSLAIAITKKIPELM